MNLVINGEQRQYDPGINALDILAGSDSELKKTAIAARLNGELIELMAPIGQDGTLEYLTFEDDEAKRVLRHTASHVLASAVKTLYPNAKLAIGPAIENGFYYDFDVEEPFTPEALEKIEKQMKHIIKKNDREVRFTLPRDEAIAFMQERNEPYKAELIRDLPEDEVLSFYRQGDFADLCAGPHLPSTGRIKAFKLTSVAGAYWRGDEKNKMLQRIYGTAFSDKEDLDRYLEMMEEAKEMIHNSVEAFVEGDEANARKVVEHDDVVDDLFNEVKTGMMQAIREQSLDADRVVDYLMMAKYLEKVGDMR